MERAITIIFKTPSHNINPCHSQNTQTSFATNLKIGLPRYGLKAKNFDGIIYKGCCKYQITTNNFYVSRSNIAFHNTEVTSRLWYNYYSNSL